MKKLLDNTIVLFVICILLLIIIPLSPSMLDAMIIINIVISLGILLITMYIKEPLEFSVFPSLLLITTLLRVSLNVSSTRLILRNSGQAGQVIKTFGEFVIGGDPVVGTIIFMIIVIVQFVIITKGSERVAEVSARFTLDAMPGKQMAIDADLSSGLISEEAARTRRSKIQREADFYGAMDGASKFVKGDAIVSIIIVFINVVAGSIIGIVGGGKSIAEVLSIYTVATVGDGLVSQIPALMISTAAGMIVTRAASENNLSSDLSKQMVAYPVAIIIAGCVLIVMCLIPGLPVGILLSLGAAFIFMGKKLEIKKRAEEEGPPDELPPDEMEFYRDSANIYSLLNVEAIEAEFGYSLIPLVDGNCGGSFIDRVVMLRRQFAAELGMVIPSVRLRDDAGLSPNEYVIRIKGEEVSRGEVLVDHFLAIGVPDDETEIEGIDTIEPAFGIAAKWVDLENKDKAQIYGYTVIDPLSVIITHLAETIRKHSNELLSRGEVYQLLENMKKVDRHMVEDIVPSIVTVADLQRVLCNLLEEQIPIRDLSTILQTLAEHAPLIKDPDILTEYVRQALKRTITRKYSQGGSLKVLTVNAEVENLIMGGIKKNERGSHIAMEPEAMHKIVAAHISAAEKASPEESPVVLTSPIVRLYYRRIIEQFSPKSVVLSFNEIEPDVKVVSLGTIAVAV